MSNKKILVIYSFFFIIPYSICFLLIGTAYNSLVNHSASLWRTLIGCLVGALAMMAIRTIVQRPIKIMQTESTRPTLKKIIGFFNISKSPFNLYANFILDFILSGIGTYLIRHLFTKPTYMGSLLGWLVTILIISVVTASNMEYESLSILESK